MNRHAVQVRNTRESDFLQIIALCERIYPVSPPWTTRALASHLAVFPEGQFVAEDAADGAIVGMAASLIVLWDDYEMNVTWREITAGGLFTNHNPNGRTLYGAEIMVDPQYQGQGIGKQIYGARRELCRRLKLLRIRAGARLRGYHKHADTMSAEEYVLGIVRGDVTDPTLTFQLRQGFQVLAVVPNYLRSDPDSLGWAAVIEWINHKVAKRKDYQARDTRFFRPPRSD